jgi:threonine dehydrogenase-like Zn-dependent dehydrogenase
VTAPSARSACWPPSTVFDLTVPMDQAAEGYRAMDERRAIKTLLTV